MTPALKGRALSQRAERALARAARDRNAQVAAGLVAGAGAAIAATKAALDHRADAGADDKARTYRLNARSPRATGFGGSPRAAPTTRWVSYATGRRAT